MAGDSPLRAWASAHRVGLLLGLIVAVGTAFRLFMASQSVTGDEVSTLWVVRDRSLGEAIDWVRSDAEITPPLNFILSWFSVRLGDAPELVRLPALISGIVSIPLTFLLGRRTVGEKAGLIGAAIMALGPFMIFFSANGRAYTLMVMLLLGSTIAMLKADETRQARWWVAYGLLSCLAMYSHYTAAFVLAAQFAWLLLARPGSRLPGLLANAGAVVLFLPWLGGLRGDLDSPTTLVLEALQGQGFDAKLKGVQGWAFGHPFVDPVLMPGRAVMILITAVLALAAVLTVRRLIRDRRGRDATPPDRVEGEAKATLAGIPSGLALILLIAIATPLGELLLGLAGTDLFGARNMTPSWYGLALGAGAVLSIPGGAVAAALTTLVLGGYAYAAVDLTRAENRVVDFADPARIIDEESSDGDVVYDMLSSLTTPVTLTPLELEMSKELPTFWFNQPTSDPPFLPGTVEIPPPREEMLKAFRAARGHRLFLFTTDWIQVVEDSESGRGLADPELAGSTLFLPENARIESKKSYPGLPPSTLYVVAVDEPSATR